MNNLLVKNIVRFVLLVLLQVLVLDTVQFGGYVVPYVFLLFVLVLPLDINKSLLLVLAFITGLTVDFFENTLGLQTAALVFMAFMRPWVLKFYFPTLEYEKGEEPGLSKLGVTGFLKYTLTLSLFYQFALTFLEVFSFRHFFQSLWEIILNALVSTAVILIVVLLFTSRKHRRRF